MARPGVPKPRGQAAVRHVVGNAAAAGAGSGNDTAKSSDWLGGMTGASGAAAPAPRGENASATAAERGVDVSTEPAGATRKGRAVESKRGQR